MLEGLDAPRAARLTSLLQRELAEHGVETVPVEGALRADDGRLYGLAGLAVSAATTSERRWRGLVADHVQRLRHAESLPEPGSMDEVREALHLRLVPREDFTDGAPVARDVVGDLAALPAVDHPDHVSFLTSAETVERLGGWDAVATVGLANLRRLRADETTTVEDGDAAVHVSGGGFFNASRLLVLDHVLREDFGIEEPSHGVLVAVPNRHVLAVHVLQGPGVVTAVRTLVGIARAESDVPGGVSRHVYYWRDGVLQQVTRDAGDDAVALVVDGPLEVAMGELGLLDDGD